MNNLPFLKPFIISNEIITGTLTSFLALQDSIAPNNPIIYPIINSFNLSTGKNSPVFPPETTIQSLSSNFTVNFALNEVEPPIICYDQNKQIYYIIFFVIDVNQNQLLFVYSFKPTAPLWTFINAIIISPTI